MVKLGSTTGETIFSLWTSVSHLYNEETGTIATFWLLFENDKRFGRILAISDNLTSLQFRKDSAALLGAQGLHKKKH